MTHPLPQPPPHPTFFLNFFFFPVPPPPPFFFLPFFSHLSEHVVTASHGIHVVTFDYASVHLVMSTVCFFFMCARINNIYFGWWWCVQHLTSWWWRLSIQSTRIRHNASNVICRNSVITVWSSADMTHHGINTLYTYVTRIRFVGDKSEKQWRVLVDAVQIVCDIPLEYPFHCWVVWLVVCLNSV